jgi:hypothetical protein
MFRSIRRSAAASGVLGVLLISALAPASVSAASETFYRFEEVATANWRIEEVCADGSISTSFISVIGGLEFESPDLSEVNEFVTVRIRNFQTCEGEFINEFGTGPAEYTGSSSLREARVTGTVTLRSGEEAQIDVSWVATGALETTINKTNFSGFSGIFTGKEREAVGTGSVIVDGENLISGPSVSGSIETLEDRNITTSS